MPTAVFQCHRKCHCDDAKCHDAIQVEYDNLSRLILEAAKVLPHHKQGVKKAWWTAELSELRTQSIEIHNMWSSEGKPRHGTTHLDRLHVCAIYKKTICAAQRAPKLASWNRLHSAMASNDTDTFWKSWRTLYSKNKSHFSPVVDGVTSKEDIANSFKKIFQNNAKPNHPQKVDELNTKFNVAYKQYSENHVENCNCHQYEMKVTTFVTNISLKCTGRCF
jgi:hypothetical protein